MKVLVELEIYPFPVPKMVELVRRSNTDGTAVPITELDIDTLHQLCEQFRMDVFKAAGKEVLEEGKKS